MHYYGKDLAKCLLEMAVKLLDSILKEKKLKVNIVRCGYKTKTIKKLFNMFTTSLYFSKQREKEPDESELQRL